MSRVKEIAAGVGNSVAEVPSNLAREGRIWPLYAILAVDAIGVGYVLQFLDHAQRFARSVGGDVRFEYGQLGPEMLIGMGLIIAGLLIHTNNDLNELAFGD
ncbi:MAG: hypothetical protein UW73_C0025G0005 [Microgenomates group bacterium GW2011_GWB1_44_8]|nr:MAG: hypothetical protein UW73_C0025G0005 [Microgenomates group bacterium GW2011_GWB1_44_8]